MKVSDVLAVIDSIAPFCLALDWDNSGLQAGDPDRRVAKAAVALDPSPETVDSALAAGSDLLITHHPLIFAPLKSLASGRPQAEALLKAVRADLPVISAHTNWDAAGMAPALAELLELKPEGFIEPVSADLLKIVVFVPPGSFGQVSEALFDAGAGEIGAYTRCSFRAEGLGGFLPPEGSDPYIGSQGVYTETAEHRLEAVLPSSLRDRCARAVRASHPYEEPAFEFYRVDIQGAYGFGIVGVWDPPREPLPWIAGRLGKSCLTLAGPVPDKASRVALLPGSGASYLPRAKAAGCELLVTGDLTHHQALLARELGIGVVSAGHHETETPGCRRLMLELAKRAPEVSFSMIREESPMPVWRAP
ncbi:MAG: Nif3-like dinuclear metal center hexameric protein [Deltaproteobacteria bacterium]|jgi:dinuclear metal center YbgI/SA1388 family protein|nr:Nif3-like dinuclear metal center hexameric protein [Deltaproteobacteria bacterium]